MLQGHSCFTVVFTVGYRGTSAWAPGPSPPLCSSALTLVCAGPFPSHVITPCCSCAVVALLPIILVALPSLLIDSALAGSKCVLEADGTDSVGQWNSLWHLTEATQQHHLCLSGPLPTCLSLPRLWHASAIRGGRVNNKMGMFSLLKGGLWGDMITNFYM